MREELEREIQGLLESGNKIEAIKRFREETGVGLAEAKSAIEAIEAGDLPAETERRDSTDLADQVIRLLERGEKIQAVKLYREEAGCGLKDAKEAVEQIGEENGIAAASGAGCFGVILLCVSAVAWLFV